MLKRIKKWWGKFRRECVTISLKKRYGFKREEITDELINIVKEMRTTSRQCGIDIDELILTYKEMYRYPDLYGSFGSSFGILCAIIKSVIYIKDRNALLCSEMILWCIRERKV